MLKSIPEKIVLLCVLLIINSACFSETINAITSEKVTTAYFTSFDGTKIYYEVAGTGKPVILVHGFTGTSQGWKHGALYQDLITNGFKVISLDLRGNGKSDKPTSAKGYENDAEAKDIIGLANHLKIKNYDVVGYSRGSIITARVLVLDNNVHKAVLGGMGTGFTDPQWPRRIMFYKALSGEPVKELEGFIKSIKQRGLDQQSLAFQQKEQPSTSPAELAKIKIPVLLISGDQDSDNGSAKELSELIPGSEIETTPGDHDHASQTPEFSKAVIGFLKK
ncbi:alpha/beta fold hydrolase [Rubrolithibacter danxiaensis]|uniref:alpha/beta fold hydrolase n=1 Tax=Rubrolithibacter danxiaensis TaxID=3390805 RepID=UPI003BF7E219